MPGSWGYNNIDCIITVRIERRSFFQMISYNSWQYQVVHEFQVKHVQILEKALRFQTFPTICTWFVPVDLKKENIREENAEKNVERNQRPEHLCVCLVHIFWNDFKEKNAEREKESTMTTMTSNSLFNVVDFSVFCTVFAELIGNVDEEEEEAAAVVLQHDSLELNKMWMPTAKKLERICMYVVCHSLPGCFVPALPAVACRADQRPNCFVWVFCSSKNLNRFERHSKIHNQIHSDGVARATTIPTLDSGLCMRALAINPHKNQNRVRGTKCTTETSAWWYCWIRLALVWRV